MSIVLSLFTFVLVLVSAIMVLVILMQRAKSDGGVGAALGGGMAEAAFGAESSNVLSRTTEYAAVIFFVLSFGLYLGNIYLHREAAMGSAGGLPDLPAAMSVPAGEQSGAPVPGDGPQAVNVEGAAAVDPQAQAPASSPAPGQPVPAAPGP
jgi:preprotein translocase subunit SecG